MRTVRRSASLASLAVATVVACSPAGPVERRTPSPDFNVVVILVDCLRADHVGAYGYPRATTPNIDRLAAESVLFEHAVAASNWTKPSVASLFTGTYVSQHRLTEGHRTSEEDGLVRSQVLAPELVTVAEQLEEAGMATGGFVNQAHLAEYMGFAQGFERYQTGLYDHEVVNAFAAWLTRARERPFFAYLHVLDLHFPYTPQKHIDIFNDNIRPRRMGPLIRTDPGKFRERVAAGDLSETDRREVAGLYDGELLGVDDTVRIALDLLRVNDLYDDTMVVLTADHGEALFDHGAFEHGGETMSEAVLHVPLLIKLPGERHGGQRVPGVVSLVDVAPTIAASLGIAPAPGIGGRPLLHRNDDGTIDATEPDPDRPILSEPTVPEALRALYLGGLKFLFPADGLDPVAAYDLNADPNETENLMDGLDAAIVARASDSLAALLDANGQFAEGLHLTETELRPEELERLRALGYIQ